MTQTYSLSSTAARSRYRKLVNVGVATLLCLSSSVFGNVIVKDGFNPLVIDNIDLSTTGMGSLTQLINYWAPTSFSIVDNMSDNARQCAYETLRTSTLDGYTGILVKPGVLLVIYDSNLMGETAVVDSGNTDIYYSGTDWNAKGQLSNIPSNVPYCYDFRYSPESQRLNLREVLKVRGTLKIGVYIEPGTPATRVSLPNLYVAKLNTSSTLVRQIISTSGMMIDVNRADCTISMPPTVPFGTISNKDPVIISQSIAIGCQGRFKADMLYQVTSKSGAGTETTIPMNNTASGNKVADVRGFLGDAGTIDAGCLDKGSSMKMNGSSNPLKTVGPNSSEVIPVNWVLCPLSSAEPGPASAALAIDFTW